MRRGLYAVLAVSVVVVGGCTSSPGDDPAGADGALTKLAGTVARADPSAPAADDEPLFTVAPLGLTFRLPGSFAPVDDPVLAFAARSNARRAFFSIAPESPSVIAHDAEDGELLSAVEIDGVDTVIVMNARLDGLPAGVAAAELLVANGSRSFSVIMSAPEADLPMLWEPFIESVSIDADG